MHHALVTSEVLLSNGPVSLDAVESRHLRTVLRIQPGDAVRLFDGEGHRRSATVAAVGRDGVTCERGGEVETLPRPPLEVTLFQCIAKPSRMDWLVEKAAELGVATLVPVLSARTVVRMQAGAKPDRWQRIADSALRQSGGGWRMAVTPPEKWPAAVMRMHRLGRPLLVGALAAGAKPLGDVLMAMRTDPAVTGVGWVIGPEGDFAPEELEAALAVDGAQAVSLGAQVLRVETAALFGLSTTLAMIRS